MKLNLMLIEMVFIFNKDITHLFRIYYRQNNHKNIIIKI